MKTIHTQDLSFQDKVKMLPEKEQRYLQGYVDRAVQAFISKQVNVQPRKLQKAISHNHQS